MDALLKSLPLGLLIRSFFAGIFFVVAHCFVRDGYTFNFDKALSIGLPVSLIAGFTIYGIHRSLIYPWIEWAFNAKWANDIRAKGWGLISEEALQNLSKLWRDKAKDDNSTKLSQAEQIQTWADYTHFQYVSALCIILGSLSALDADFPGHPILFPLFLLRDICVHWEVYLCAVIFCIAGISSNWRLFSVLAYIRKDENANRKDKPTSNRVSLPSSPLTEVKTAYHEISIQLSTPPIGPNSSGKHSPVVGNEASGTAS